MVIKAIGKMSSLGECRGKTGKDLAYNQGALTGMGGLREGCH
jgi:hypothetical protein